MIEALRKNNLRPVRSEVNPEVHKTSEALQLKETCQQFESILWAKLWKDMRNTARAIGGEEDRPWKQMEDLSLEMASDDLVAGSGGTGLWKVLYDNMVGKLASDLDQGETQRADAEADAAFEEFQAESFEARG